MQIVVIRKIIECEDAVQLLVYHRSSQGKSFKDRLVLDMIFERYSERLDVRTCEMCLVSYNREFQGFLSYLKML